MSPSIGCLEEPELLVLLSGEPASELLRAHLHDCPDCRSRLDKRFVSTPHAAISEAS